MYRRIVIGLIVITFLLIAHVLAGVMRVEKPKAKVETNITTSRIIFLQKWEGVVDKYKEVDLGTVEYHIYRYAGRKPQLTYNGHTQTVTTSYINDLLDDYGITIDWHINGDSYKDTKTYSGTKTWTEDISYIVTWMTEKVDTSNTQENVGEDESINVEVITTTYTLHQQEVVEHTTYKQHANVTYCQKDPLVLDLDGNGVADVPKGITAPHDFFMASRARLFDINGDNILDLIEWIGPNDGLLAIKTDTGIKTAAELLSNVVGYANGFEKLRVLIDKNHDNWISGDELDDLVVWRDINGDAKAQPEEVKPVSYYHIVKIYAVPDDDMKAYYITEDGSKHLIWEWWPSSYLSIGINK